MANSAIILPFQGSQQLGPTLVASNSAVIQFNNLITSSFSRYVIIGTNIQPATNATTLEFNYGTGATPTYDTSTHYMYSGYYNSASPGLTALSSNTTPIAFGPLCEIGNMANTSTNSFVLELYLPASSNAFKEARSMQNLTTATTINSTLLTHVWNNATPATSIQFLMSSGNLTTGNFSLFGMV